MYIGQSLKSFFVALITPVSWAFKQEPMGSTLKTHTQADLLFGSQTPTGDIKQTKEFLSDRIKARISQLPGINIIYRLYKAIFGTNPEKEVLAFDERVDSIKTRDLALGGEGEALKNEIKRFLTAHPELSNEMKLHALKALQTLKSVMKLFKMHENILELSKFPLDQNGCLDVPADGNCLYYSIQAGLSVAMGKEGVPNPEGLRKQTVEDMRENYQCDDFLRELINDTIEQYNEKQRREISEELSSLAVEKELANLSSSKMEEAERNIRSSHQPIASVDEYFERAAQPKFWGSTPEMYSMAKRYKVQFVVTAVQRDEKTKEEKVLYSDQPTAGRDEECKIYLKLTNNNHYDCYFDRIQAGLNPRI